MVGSKDRVLSNMYYGVERRDLRFTDKRFHIYSMETCVRKLLLKFDGDQTVGSKVIPFRTGTVVWSDETSASPKSDYTSTPKKTASRNSCKNLREIQRSDQKLWPFRTGTLVYSAETYVQKLL